MKKLLFIFLFLPGIAFGGEILVVVNAKNPSNKLTKEDIKRVYLEDQLWDSGSKVRRFFTTDNVELRDAVCSIFGLTCNELGRHFKAKQYRVGLTPERPVDSSNQLLRLVGTFKGGIGFVDSREAKGLISRKTKIVYRIKY